MEINKINDKYFVTNWRTDVIYFSFRLNIVANKNAFKIPSIKPNKEPEIFIQININENTKTENSREEKLKYPFFKAINVKTKKKREYQILGIPSMNHACIECNT